MTHSDQILIGWREWLVLPELHLGPIKAKVDTGARTSALHAFALETFTKNDQLWVEFSVHPISKNEQDVVVCQAPVIDERQVTDSGGHKELRCVIKTPVKLGEHVWPIEITLTNRDTMSFRMLLGRNALPSNFIINPKASFLLKKPEKVTL